MNEAQKLAELYIDSGLVREDEAMVPPQNIPIGKHNQIPDDQFDKNELEMGIKVELEHTDNPEFAKSIAKDHLAECSRYYTYLAKMESICKKEDEMRGVVGKEKMEGGLEESLLQEQGVKLPPMEPGCLEVPEGKNLEDMTLDHFKTLSRRKGFQKVSNALVRIQVWNKTKNPKLSNWADDMQAKLSKWNDTQKEE